MVQSLTMVMCGESSLVARRAVTPFSTSRETVASGESLSNSRLSPSSHLVQARQVSTPRRLLMRCLFAATGWTLGSRADSFDIGATGFDGLPNEDASGSQRECGGLLIFSKPNCG